MAFSPQSPQITGQRMTQPMTSQHVSLRVNYCTNFGESIFVSGTLWDSWNKPQSMTWNEGSWWEFCFDVPLPLSDDIFGIDSPSFQLEYKYLKRNFDGKTLEWERTENRKLTISKKTHSTLVVDCWNHPEMSKISWGLTETQKKEEEKRQKREDIQAQKAGWLSFGESIAMQSDESAKARQEKEKELLAEQEKRHQNEIREQERRRLKKLHVKTRNLAGSPSTSPGGFGFFSTSRTPTPPATPTSLIVSSTTPSPSGTPSPAITPEIH